MRTKENGHDQALYLAPNGNPSNLTPEQWHLVRTPKFKEWFGDWEKLAIVKRYDSGIDEVSLESLSKDVSKVVDENGEPLVVYHSTNNDFTIFNTIRKGGEHFGVYFSANKESTKIYGQKVSPFFIKSINPEVPKIWSHSVIDKYKMNYMTKNNYDGAFWVRKKEKSDDTELYEVVVFEPEQIKLADGTNTTFDGNNPDIRYADGGEVEDLISKGIVDLKMYETTPEHAREYGLRSINPLYIQTICVNNDSRLKGIGKKVLAYIDEYARNNGNDVVFGRITQKAEFTKDERQNFYCDIDLIKNWLYSNGYAINDDNNDFHKVIQKNVRYHNGGTMKKSIADGGTTNEGVIESESTLLAPNGKKSNLTAEQYKLVRTPEFKAWFGDWENDPENASKVVDENGEPLVVYRGWSSNRSFGYVFNYNTNLFGSSDRSTSRKKNRFGFYFTPSKPIAEVYAEDFATSYNDDLDYRGLDKTKATPIVQSYFLNIRRILNLTETNPSFPSIEKLSDNYNDFIKKLYGSGLNKKRYKENYDRTSALYGTELGLKDLSDMVGLTKKDFDGNQYLMDKYEGNDVQVIYSWFINNDTQSDTIIREKIISKGYNGVFFKETTGLYQTLSPKEQKKYDQNFDKGIQIEYPFVFAAFEPNQIKLADGTNTTFDGNNPDIRFDDGGITDQYTKTKIKRAYVSIRIKREVKRADSFGMNYVIESFDKKPFEELRDGALKGILGVSTSSYNISDWLIHRDCLLVMPFNDFVELNEAEQVLYEDANYLTKNGLEPLFRLYDRKSRDDQAYYSILQTMFPKISHEFRLEHQASDKGNLYYHIGGYFDVHSSSKFMKYVARQPRIDSPEALAQILCDYINSGESKLDYYEYTKFDKIEVDDVIAPLTLGIVHSGKAHMEESEWLIKNAVLRVPDGTQLYFVLGGYENMKEEYEKIIDEYNLREKYKVYFVKESDLNRFQQQRWKVKSERFNQQLSEKKDRVSKKISNALVDIHNEILVEFESNLMRSIDADEFLKATYFKEPDGEKYENYIEIPEVANFYNNYLYELSRAIESVIPDIVTHKNKYYLHDVYKTMQNYDDKLSEDFGGKRFEFMDEYGNKFSYDDLIRKMRYSLGEINLVAYADSIKNRVGADLYRAFSKSEIMLAEGGTTNEGVIESESTLLAPNGKPSNLTPEQWHLVRTPEFKAWFGDWENDPENASKVVDENGEPKVMWHSSTNEFTIFNPEFESRWTNQRKEKVIWFGGSDKVSAYSEGYSEFLYQCFLNSKNPIIVDAKKHDESDYYKDEKGNKTYSIQRIKGRFISELGSVSWDGKKNTNDGVIFYNAWDNVPLGLVVAIPNPNQIKLADGTNTTFDGNNPDIRYADGGEIDSGLLFDFAKNIEEYQSNHYGAYNRNRLVESYLKLPTWVKAKIQPNTTENLFRGADGLDSKKSAISFTRNKDYAMFFGAYVIPFKLVESSDGLIDTHKLRTLLDDLNIDNEIGDDEGEVIVINPKYSSKGIDDIETYRFNNGGTMKESIADGGITYGASHEEGGIKVHNKGTNEMLEVEGGESVINKRSMASDKTVVLDGKEMSVCEAASELNELEGGVKFNCEDVEGKQFLEQGGELQKGIDVEKEHIDTLDKLYHKEIKPNQAVEEIAKEHIAENPKYYSDLMKEIRKHKHVCGDGCRTYANGGRLGSLGSLEGLVKKSLEEKGQKTEEQEIIDFTIRRGRELLDSDYLPMLKENLPDKYKPYLIAYKELNLYKLGWRLQFGSSRDWAGLCSYRAKGSLGQSNAGKDVYLSIQFTKWDRNWKDNADDVILHEIAHAIVNELFIFKLGMAFYGFDPTHKPLEGHGQTWADVCNAINTDGACSRYYANKDLMDNFKFFKYICNYCGDMKFSNSQGFAKNCFRCNKPVIVQKNK